MTHKFTSQTGKWLIDYDDGIPVRIAESPQPPDPRDPDHSRSGIFVSHNCWKCANGAKPCARGNRSWCEYPHARND